MEYLNIKEGIFKSRPNRFIAIVSIDGRDEICHVKNTGRCKELLIPGCIVYLEESQNPLRKTKYDLISVVKNENGGKLLINIDSQIPNDMTEEWLYDSGLFSNNMKYKREYSCLDSRFDFFIEDNGKKILLEVKGVTLENDGVVLFPDAPTERGRRHISELIKWKELGNESYILFVIQLENPKYFTPNDITDVEFSRELKRAKEKGVNIIVVDSVVSINSIKINNFIEVRI